MESFSALLELLDDQRFARGTIPDRKQLDVVMVRRLKSEMPARFDGTPRFPKRHLEALQVSYTAEEKAVHTLLKQYAQERLKNHVNQSETFATEFVLKTLKKRLFSSPAAFAITLAQHERSLQTATRRRATIRPTVGILQRLVDRVDEEYADDDEYQDATDDAVESATRLFREPSSGERDSLKRMKSWAEQAKHQPDSKCAVLMDWLKKQIRPGGQNGRTTVSSSSRSTEPRRIGCNSSLPWRGSPATTGS